MTTLMMKQLPWFAFKRRMLLVLRSARWFVCCIEDFCFAINFIAIRKQFFHWTVLLSPVTRTTSVHACMCVCLCVDYCIWFYLRNENRFSTPRVNERLETLPRTLHFRVSSMWGGRARYRFGSISRYLNSGVIYCPLFRYREPFESGRKRRKITDLVQTNQSYWNFTWLTATVLMASCEVMMFMYHRLCVRILSQLDLLTPRTNLNNYNSFNFY